MTNLVTLHSSQRHTWQTPDDLWALVIDVLGPDVWDPCPPEPTHDGLAITWRSPWYCNPPYGRELPHWVDKARQQAAGGKCGILLTPARTDTRWWHRAWHSADAVCLWRGRLTFRDAPHPAPFPSALFLWGPQVMVDEFRRVFGARGIVMDLWEASE